VALLTFAAERRAAVPGDISYPPAWPTAANLLRAAAAGEWDRRTDGHRTVT